jgi:hypothetical protein
MRIRIKKIESTHDNLRTDEVEGDALFPPQEGQRFVMYAEPIVPLASFRMVTTSRVTDVYATHFKTLHSTYAYEVIG